MKKIYFMIILIVLITGCKSNEVEPVVISGKSIFFSEVSDIDYISVVDGTTGEKKEINDDKTFGNITKLIKESNFVLQTDKEEDSTGWSLGIKVSIDNELLWFTQKGVAGYKYEDSKFYDELLYLVIEEEEIDFVVNYLEARSE